MVGENVAKGTVDRISELPEFILHTILSILDTKEAGRASVLSKRWFDAWSSIPVLDFRHRYFHKFSEFCYEYDKDTVERLVGFIEKTMERYFTRKYRITKMHLELPEVDEKLEPLVDKWIMNKFRNLKSRILVEMNIGCLIFYFVQNRYGDMLQRIISSCPLAILDIMDVKCLKKIAIPWMEKVKGGVERRGSETMQSTLQESPLQKIVYSGLGNGTMWPWNMNVIALKKLRKLEFDCVPITDDVVSELSYGLVVLESLVISICFMLKCINISSKSLKQLSIADCEGLTKATIDAPKLLEFLCSCKVETSLSLIRALDHCNAHILIEEDQLRNVGTGAPYKLRELKLRGTSDWTPTKSSLVAFLNGLFWCCHPDVLSMTTNLQDSTAKLILSILREKAQCWKDPLKSIAVESIEYPQLLSHSSEFEIRLRLSW
ncbi:hypothetical protein KSS87_023486 [Heliosperma pusillum]|nr:hypothetical protein KSS87_023486 [Heliosperma pusillum]